MTVVVVAAAVLGQQTGNVGEVLAAAADAAWWQSAYWLRKRAFPSGPGREGASTVSLILFGVVWM